MKNLLCLFVAFYWFNLLPSELRWDGDRNKISSSQNELSILWWSTKESGAQKSLRPDLYHNLMHFAQRRSKLDVIALSEFNLDTLLSKENGAGAHLFTTLRQQYNYYFFVPYNDGFHKNSGIAVFSKLEIISKKILTTQWFPNKQGKQYFKKWIPQIDSQVNPKNMDFCLRQRLIDTVARCLAHSSYYVEDIERRLPVVVLKKDDSLFKLIPIHLYNSWRMVSKLKLLSKISLGKSDPNYFQLQSVLNNAKENQHMNRTIMFGDFNIPQITPYTSEPVKRFNEIQEKGFNLLSSLDKTTSYPTAQYRKMIGNIKRFFYPNVKIDHAFVTKDLRGTSEVLRLKGSDHYPLFIKVKIPSSKKEYVDSGL